MARERFSLVSNEEKREVDIRRQIETGEMNPEVFAQLPPEEQAMVSNVLFEMASAKIEPNQGTSALEFILFGFIRIMNKKVSGMSLTAEDRVIEEQLRSITSMHQITDGVTPKSEWLFDYMEYAQQKSAEFLQNRQEHIERKKNVIGQV